MDQDGNPRQAKTHEGGVIRTEMSQGAPVKDKDYTAWILAKRSPLFAGLLPTDHNKLSAAARAKEFRRGEILHIEGDAVQQIILVTTGFVKITQLGLRGAEVILRLSGPGDVLGGVGLFSKGKHYTTAQAFRSCCALVWEAAVFKSMVAHLPGVHHNMVGILDKYLAELEQRFREVATEKVAPRVASQIVRLMDAIGRPVSGEIEVGISREELAQMTGTTLFTVSRLLSSWEARGMVRPLREAVVVCDVKALIAIGDKS